MSWLTKFLGYDAMLLAKDNEIISLYNEVHSQRQRADIQDSEIARLTNLMLTRAGFIVPEVQGQEKSNPQPISRKESWPVKQRRLEQEDAKRAADAVERHWKSKSGTSQEGTSVDQADGTSGS